MTEYNLAGMSENDIFVHLLSQHQIIFRRPTTESERKKQEAARFEITRQYNEKCNTHLTAKQVSRKLNNIKCRLKDKTAKNLTRIKVVGYHQWEKNFYRMWTGEELLYPASFMKTGGELYDSPTCSPNFRNEASIEESDTTLPVDFIMKVETDYNMLGDEDETLTFPETPKPAKRKECQQEPDPISDAPKEKNDDKFEKMSLEELQRIALISQTKMQQAQEAAARAKEKLSLYKLYLLKKSNEEYI